jgi:hypothetical protein
MVGTAFRMDGGKREGRVNEFGGDGEALDALAEVDFSRLLFPLPSWNCSQMCGLPPPGASGRREFL